MHVLFLQIFILISTNVLFINLPGAPGDDDGSARSGAVYVIVLGQDGDVVSNQKISRLSGQLTAEFTNYGTIAYHYLATRKIT